MHMTFAFTLFLPVTLNSICLILLYKFFLFMEHFMAKRCTGCFYKTSQSQETRVYH